MKIAIPVILFLTFLCCGQASSQGEDNQDITQHQIDTCDSPDAAIRCCFADLPASLSNIMAITAEDEPGEKLVISGTIFKADGKTPYPDVILYAYQTDNTGHYSKNGTEKGVQKWHGRLHAWSKTDRNGHYKIQTIRPGRYPDNSMPAHIHAAIKTDSGKMYWISDFVFKDDSLADEKYVSSLVNVGGTGVVAIKKNPDNILTGKRDIVLK